MDKLYRFTGTVLIGSLMLTLSACMNSTSYAPVVNAWQQPGAKSGTYLVQKGDTVYSIAWAFGLDYRALAIANHLKPPYGIKPGERLQMSTVPRQKAIKQTVPRLAEKTASSRPSSVLKSEKVIKVYADKKKQPSRWAWPARGRIAQGFSNGLAGNKGINIAGRFGAPVRAAATGRVVYCGDGVRGYGNLLIIKHNDSYLSAYAYNKKLLVKLGDRVRAGQTIAEMGRDNAGSVMLHFEIRRNGKPVNPMRYLHA